MARLRQEVESVRGEAARTEERARTAEAEHRKTRSEAQSAEVAHARELRALTSKAATLSASLERAREEVGEAEEGKAATEDSLEEARSEVEG